MCLGLFAALSAAQPMPAFAATITPTGTYVEARSFALAGGVSAEDVGNELAGQVNTRVSVVDADASALARLLLTDAAAGQFAFAMAGALIIATDGSFSQADASGVARYAFVLDGPAVLAVRATSSSVVSTIVDGELDTFAGGSILGVTLNDVPLNLSPSNQGVFNLLAGVPYSLEATAWVSVSLAGAGAIQAAGTGVLDFSMTSVSVPEPSTGATIVAGLAALSAARWRRRSGARLHG